MKDKTAQPLSVGDIALDEVHHQPEAEEVVLWVDVERRDDDAESEADLDCRYRWGGVELAGWALERRAQVAAEVEVLVLTRSVAEVARGRHADTNRSGQVAACSVKRT